MEDLAFRYLAGGERVDNWALSAFRRRHGRGLNNMFTQVLETVQDFGLVKLGRGGDRLDADQSECLSRSGGYGA